MTRGVALALILAAGMAIAILGSWVSSRPAKVGRWLRARRPEGSGTRPTDTALELAGAVTAVVGIFVTVVAIIAEIWWRQGVNLP